MITPYPFYFFFLNDPAPPDIYPLSLHDALPIYCALCHAGERDPKVPPFSYRPGDKLDDYFAPPANAAATADVHGNQVALLQRTKCFRSSPGMRSEEHTSELQSQSNLVCRLLLEQ